MGRRTVLLVVAFLLAALGTGLVFSYVNSANDRALEDQKPKRVLVVKTLLAQGTTVRDAEKAGAFELKVVASASIAEGALSDLAPVRDLVALAPLFPGEQVLAAKFGAAGTASVLPIPNGKLAISVQLADPARVAGFVEPGSEVAIFTTGSIAAAGLPPTDFSAVLLPRITVLAVGPTTVTQAAGSTAAANQEALPRAILTLAVTQREASQIFLAESKAELSLALLNKSSTTQKTSPVTLSNLFN